MADSTPIDTTPPAATPDYGTTEPLVGGSVNDADVVGAWKADVFGCFSNLWPNCAMSLVCPCVSLAQSLHRVGIYTYQTTLAVLAFLYVVTWAASYMVADLSQGLGTSSPQSMPWTELLVLTNIVYLVFVITTRAKLRRLMHIPGSYLEDICCSFWCQCCVIAQMATQVDAYTAGECNFGPKDTLPGYAV
ncbi:Aste57867_2979 [Aphanomyces stellatus]|uniref:Aste57867_2979 protein n=1 Tax=Aphanomyces stellatus TaxID=120398 RepID=A0A485K8S9_9STRA|nr:hypothetical protein As57867_002970 [Aphanomyces stellatus]VFT80161.1 Aste57867_2979 [Aphanomyces stellatus]